MIFDISTFLFIKCLLTLNNFFLFVIFYNFSVKEYADVVSLKDLKESESFSQYFGTTEHFDQQLSKEEQVRY